VEKNSHLFCENLLMKFISLLIWILFKFSFVLLPCLGISSLNFSSCGLTKSRINYLQAVLSTVDSHIQHFCCCWLPLFCVQCPNWTVLHLHCALVTAILLLQLLPFSLLLHLCMIFDVMGLCPAFISYFLKPYVKYLSVFIVPSNCAFFSFACHL